MTTINHWGKWVDSETPVTGVISSNNIAWECIDNEICTTCDEAFEEIENCDACPECGGDLMSHNEYHCGDDHFLLIGSFDI